MKDKESNNILDFLLNFTLVYSLFFVFVVVPYAIGRNIKIKIFGIDFFLIAITLFIVYLFVWIYLKKRYLYEERRKITSIRKIEDIL